MRLLIVGTLKGQLTTATKIAMDNGATVTKVRSGDEAIEIARRARPDLINASRKKRIARGSGKSVADDNRLLKQWAQMNKMMKSVASMPKSRKRALFGRGARPA